MSGKVNVNKISTRHQRSYGSLLMTRQTIGKERIIS